MRITPEQIAIIIQTTRSIAGQDANVWLYGSRLDDTRRGATLTCLSSLRPQRDFWSVRVSKTGLSKFCNCLWMC